MQRQWPIGVKTCEHIPSHARTMCSLSLTTPVRTRKLVGTNLTKALLSLPGRTLLRLEHDQAEFDTANVLDAVRGIRWLCERGAGSAIGFHRRVAGRLVSHAAVSQGVAREVRVLVGLVVLA